jgi:electron-transferring-flavoprotein dehydrogenase
MTPSTDQAQRQGIERQKMDVDIVCVGFGPATAGFLTTLSREVMNEDGTPRIESKVSPGMPLQVMCYERADGIGYGVSGVVTRAKGLKASFQPGELEQIPLTAPVGEEKLLYLLDPVGASRRPALLRLADRLLRALGKVLPWFRDDSFEMPLLPPFLHKKGGFVLSLGQFLQHVGNQLMGGGVVQIWPGTPVAQALVIDDRVIGVRLADQGVDKHGSPDAGYMPGMDIHAHLTVVGDGPVGAIGAQLNEHFGMPRGHHQWEWALGMKFVVDLPADTPLKAGQVFHTFGYPEPDIFGFLYVYPDRVASLGIFVPSWMSDPTKTAYRTLQHWMQHPALWKYLKGSTLRSWGAKSLQESGLRGEPVLTGDGFARIGEGSGSTNVLTGSGVDEAWTTGVQLAEAVLALYREGKPFTKENLEAAYVRKRRASWLGREGRVAARSRDGFESGFLQGMIGMGLAGMTGGLLNWPGTPRPPYRHTAPIGEFLKGKMTPDEIDAVRRESDSRGVGIGSAVMTRTGWPAVEHDGQVLVSHQDALLVGGKVQAPPGYADHVTFLSPGLCRTCGEKLCIDMCSGQAITPGEGGVPVFDREKCVHCGACMWNCSKPYDESRQKANVEFRAGTGGLHSAEN